MQQSSYLFRAGPAWPGDTFRAPAAPRLLLTYYVPGQLKVLSTEGYCVWRRSQCF